MILIYEEIAHCFNAIVHFTVHSYYFQSNLLLIKLLNFDIQLIRGKKKHVSK